MNKMNISSSLLEKIKRYCALQERCAFEIENYAAKLKIDKSEIKSIIEYLKKEDFLNEQRYVSLFVSGKLKNNKWGKIKIREELRKRNIPSAIIEKHLKEIDEEEYNKIAQNLIDKKLATFAADLSEREKREKLFRYMYSKGFEVELIEKIIDRYGL